MRVKSPNKYRCTGNIRDIAVRLRVDETSNLQMYLPPDWINDLIGGTLLPRVIMLDSFSPVKHLPFFLAAALLPDDHDCLAHRAGRPRNHRS